MRYRIDVADHQHPDGPQRTRAQRLRQHNSCPVDLWSAHETSDSRPVMEREKLLWHPEVHQRFGETLHYYAVSPASTSGEFAAAIETLVATVRISGCCRYEVFG